MSRTVPLPPKGAGLPQGIQPFDECAGCGDFVCWCPVWCRRWPQLEAGRDESST